MREIGLKKSKEMAEGNKKERVKVIGSVVESSDPYSWEELNCFNRSWAILAAAFNSNYFDMFLFYLSFYNSYMAEGYFCDIFRTEKFYLPFMKFYNEIMQDRLGLSIKLTECASEDEMHEKIMDEIDNDRPVLVGIDLMGLYYNEAYQERSQGHFFIIKGYDSKKKIYYILDNMQIDGGSKPTYRNFVLRACDLYGMSLLFIKNRCPNSNKPYFWSVGELPQKSTGEADVYRALLDHYELYKRINSNQVQINYLDKEVISDIDFYKDQERLRVIFIILNLKVVYYDILFRYLAQVNAGDQQIEKLKEHYGAVDLSWKKIRSKIRYNIARRIDNYEELEVLINKNIGMEYKLREMFIEIIDGLDLYEAAENKQKSSQNDMFFVRNTNKAQIIKADDSSYTIIHSSDTEYDTWILRDNAPQLLVQSIDGRNFSIEAKVVVYNEIYAKFHSGIIVKLANGAKYIFGNHKGSGLSIFSPESIDNSLLYETKLSSDTVYLKVEKAGAFINFYSKAANDDVWEMLHRLSCEEEVRHFGLISKTWEAIEHTCEFSDIKVVKG